MLCVPASTATPLALIAPPITAGEQSRRARRLIPETNDEKLAMKAKACQPRFFPTDKHPWRHWLGDPGSGGQGSYQAVGLSTF